MPCDLLLGHANDAMNGAPASPDFHAQSIIELWSRRYCGSGKASCLECRLFVYECAHYDVLEKKKATLINSRLSKFTV